MPLVSFSGLRAYVCGSELRHLLLRLCSASSLMSFSSFSNMSSGVIFGFAVYRKDFGQVRFVRCSSNSFIEFSVFAILFSTVL